MIQKPDYIYKINDLSLRFNDIIDDFKRTESVFNENNELRKENEDIREKLSKAVYQLRLVQHETHSKRMKQIIQKSLEEILLKK